MVRQGAALGDSTGKLRRSLLAMVLAVLANSFAGLLPFEASAQIVSVESVAPPELDAEIADIKWGIFCALREMDRVPAPGTLSGWMHVPKEKLDFHWPHHRVVPAALGLAFGVRARLAEGAAPIEVEIRVYRPGLDRPDVWTSWLGESFNLVFFRFDTEDELLTGRWRFEAWNGERQLYAVDFQVVPAAALAGIADICGATS